MNITADTNVLVRAVVMDHRAQARLAREVLEGATLIAVPLSSLCEVVWVLREAYKFTPQWIAFALQELLSASNVRADRPAVEAGLEFLRLGGDFADGVIAHNGRLLGGSIFVSFDRKAAHLAKAQGFEALLLSPK